MHVQVPTSVIRNEDHIFIDNGCFLLYVRLCFLYFRNYKNEEIKIDHKKLMRILHVNDTRTLKKRLDGLYKANLIQNKISSLPRKGEIAIVFNSKILNESKHFTMMNAKIFDYMNDINEHSFRLLFYYKSHINLNDDKKLNYCFVGIETLKVKLKMGSDTIHQANNQLKENKLIKITRHKLETTYEYDENDELIFDRYNNHYIVNENLF